MRLSTRVVAVCVGLFVSHQAAALELPQRWVSAGGALSEWVSALGGESKLVGVDTTSQHPDSLKALPSIGYQRQLSAEGLLSLRPQMLIGTEEMGPPPVLSQIRSAGVQVELFSAQPDLLALQGNLQHLASCSALKIRRPRHSRPINSNWISRSCGSPKRRASRKRRACCCCWVTRAASR